MLDELYEAASTVERAEKVTSRHDLDLAHRSPLPFTEVTWPTTAGDTSV